MTQLLIQYGRTAFVGVFTGPDEQPVRGTAVVIRSPRGVERGTVLGSLADRFTGQFDPSAGGEYIRVLSQDDETAERKATTLAEQILDAAEQYGKPVTFLDCEAMLDGRTAVLHAVAWADCELDPMLAELSDRFGLAIRLMDVASTPTRIDPPEPKTSCSKPDCGTGEGNCSTGGCGTSGGCSTGSCSRGSVKNAEDLTVYFADLREKMEATGRQPLN
jgi:hypothetical protein